MRFLPGVLKELLKHVPTVIFEVVDWSLLGHELPKMTRRLLQKEGFEEIYGQQKSFLTPFGIILSDQVDKHFDLKNQKLAAEKLLALYFAQLFSPHGLFLDLGPNHFDLKNDELYFKPSGMWTKFSDDFTLGLRNVYDGFYYEDETLFHQGLLSCGLTSKDWSEKEKQQLAHLFRSNFGDSLSEGMKFELEPFKESFFKIADFMLEKKVKISTDFLYLGIALVTLFASLEMSESSVNVKQIYLDVKKQLNSQSK